MKKIVLLGFAVVVLAACGPGPSPSRGPMDNRAPSNLEAMEKREPGQRPPEYRVFENNWSMIFFDTGENGESQVAVGDTFELSLEVFGAADRLEVEKNGRVIRSLGLDPGREPHHLKVVFQQKSGDYAYGSTDLAAKAYVKQDFVTRSFTVTAVSKDVSIVHNGERPEFRYRLDDKGTYTLCTLDLFPQDLSDGMPLFYSPPVLPFHKYVIEGPYDNTLMVQIPVVDTPEEYKKGGPVLSWTNPKGGVDTQIRPGETSPYYSRGLQIKFFPDGSWLWKGETPHEGTPDFLWGNAVRKEILVLSDVAHRRLGERFTVPLFWDYQDGTLRGEEYLTPWTNDQDRKDLALFQVDSRTLAFTKKETRIPAVQDYDLHWLAKAWP